MGVQRRRIIKHWIEDDVHTGWRREYAYLRYVGNARKIKNLTNRRERREARGDIAEQLDD